MQIYSSSAAAARTAAPPHPQTSSALVHAHVLDSGCRRIVQQVKGGFSRHQISGMCSTLALRNITISTQYVVRADATPVWHEEVTASTKIALNRQCISVRCFGFFVKTKTN